MVGYLVELLQVSPHVLVVQLNDSDQCLKCIVQNFRVLYPEKIENTLHDLLLSSLVLKVLLRSVAESGDALGDNSRHFKVLWIDVVKHGVPNPTEVIWVLVVSRHQGLLDQTEVVNASHLEEGVLVLVSLVAHHLDEVAPLASWDFDTSNSRNAETDVLHELLVYRSLRSQVAQKCILDVLSGLRINLVPGALVDRLLTILECVLKQGVLEEDAGQLPCLTIFLAAACLLVHQHHRHIDEIHLKNINVSKFQAFKDRIREYWQELE